MPATAPPAGFGNAKLDIETVPAGKRFGVLYLGGTLKVCFLEALLRDRRDGQVGGLPIEEIEIHARRFAEIETTEELHLVDLRDDHAVRKGVPSDVAKASRQSLARAWSLAFYEHKSSPDGIIYPSRLNGHINLAVFDRAVSKLAAKRVVPLMGAPGLASVLRELLVALV